MISSWLEMQLFPQDPLPAPHQQIADNFSQLPTDYGSLLAIYRLLYGF